MASFTEKNWGRSITLRSRWALSQYRSYVVGPETPFSPCLKSVSRRLIQVPCSHRSIDIRTTKRISNPLIIRYVTVSRDQLFFRRMPCIKNQARTEYQLRLGLRGDAVLLSASCSISTCKQAPSFRQDLLLLSVDRYPPHTSIFHSENDHPQLKSSDMSQTSCVGCINGERLLFNRANKIRRTKNTTDALGSGCPVLFRVLTISGMNHASNSGFRYTIHRPQSQRRQLRVDAHLIRFYSGSGRHREMERKQLGSDLSEAGDITGVSVESCGELGLESTELADFDGRTLSNLVGTGPCQALCYG
jgi:hypothetical protein